MDSFFHELLTSWATPELSLLVLFACSVLSATLLPLGSEPVLLAVLALHPALLWLALLVATVGNTLGGAIGWWMGWGAERWRAHRLQTDLVTVQMRALRWLERLGPAACLGAWLPIIGDPLCVVAGYLRLPFWPCVAYMAVGKAMRYVVLVSGWTWLMAWW
ncbi:MAG: DedA family protein [Betaproteobacteria bacterium]|nr:DedA family protein [Betaproteobacteria bacterium]